VIYVQAKRWEASVGRPEIQKFVGSLEGHHASKGVFITTSTFSKDAREYVRTVGKRIRLIDGPELAQLMVDYGVASPRSRATHSEGRLRLLRRRSALAA